MKIRMCTMERIRELYEHGVESLMERSVSDKELIQFLNENNDMEIEYVENLKMYRVIYEPNNKKLD